MSVDESTPNELLKEYIDILVQSRQKGGNQELEVIFGEKDSDSISRIDFENVIGKLKSIGFTSGFAQNDGEYYLNIQNQFINKATGRTGIGNIRTTISGVSQIQEYCEKNTFDLDNPPKYVQFMQKVPKIHNGNRLAPISYDDFHFRINYKEEKILKPNFGIVKGLLQSWNNEKKVFRLIKRFTFRDYRFPYIKIDCSIVRSSKIVRKRMIPEFRIESSNVFNNPEKYEIEIEIDSSKFPERTDDFADILMGNLRKTIKYVMSGLQETNFPISYKDQNLVLREYMHVLYKNPPERRIKTRDFVGPSSKSLELPNIVPLDDDIIVPNIRLPYTVTEKADGIRKLLFINSKGYAYLINVNMKVQFTGTITKQKDLMNTIIDGEHVLHDKRGAFINNYLAFDIYYINKKDIRSEPFYVSDSSAEKGRLVLLNKTLKNIKFEGVVGEIIPLKVRAKTFHAAEGVGIFAKCKEILNRVSDGLFEYETDGLIFTPANKGVGSNTVGETLDPVKRTWGWSFKWKPPDFNTIDFLVTTQKTEGGSDFVGNIFENGDNMNAIDNLTQYKTLILRVGFNEKQHGLLNPCEDVIQDRFPKKNYREEKSSYKPVPFYPINPTPQFPAYLCNIVLENSGESKLMLTEDKTGVIEDETIVEFKYNKTKDKFWQWVPIRVRLDKTADYRSGGRNFGNAHHVAQSVWNSIHNPVTKDMLVSGLDIPDLIADDDIYYNKKNNGAITKAMRNFHNLFVKRLLILGASKRGDTLIDMTVGKGGDFPKWIAAKLSFVFGLDVARDNIENRMDGACARYIQYRRQFKTMPHALFVNANSENNIKSTEACITDKGKEITRAIFGEGPRDEKKLGKGVFRQYGKAKDGFDVVSNQFSIHYFFKDVYTLNGFLRNVSECCKVGGYFIGSSYDGRRVFRELESKSMGESISIHKNDTKMWSITKEYQNEEFPDDAGSLGYEIKVYQETINKTFSEYLVNFEYLIRIIKNYGFVLLEREEARDIGLPESIGNFDQLYYEMESQLKQHRIRKSDIGSADKMSVEEKKISFLNKYFIFKKVMDVNAEEVSRTLTDMMPIQEKIEAQSDKILAKVLSKPGPRITKKKNKVKLGIGKIPVESIPLITIKEDIIEPVVVLPPGSIIKPIKVKVSRKSRVKVKVGTKVKVKVKVGTKVKVGRKVGSKMKISIKKGDE
jgi:hypothetical protein